LDPFLISVGKSLISPFTKLASVAYEKFRRPSIEYKKAPSNLFEHIKPRVTFEKMQEILGVPHRRYENKYLFVFSDLFVQIIIDENRLVSSVSAALTKITFRSRFKTPALNFVLGKTNFVDVLEDDSPIELDFSSKHYHYWTKAYYGFPGLYLHYAFGVLEATGIPSPPGKHWSPDLDQRSDIPHNKKVNWICIADSDEIPPFSYLGFL